MANDEELKAMEAVIGVLSGLEEAARHRVISWAAERFGVTLAYGRGPQQGGGARQAVTAPGGSTGGFAAFSELFDSAAPSTEMRRALVAGYWFQVISGEPDVTGKQVNDELKQLGHPLSNVTVAFRNLQIHSPVLARQVQKGKGKMAHKRYRLTEAGIRVVEKLLRGEQAED